MFTVMNKDGYNFKVTIIGDGGVGKTSILRRYMSNTFEANYISTLGVDYSSKEMKVNDKNVKLTIWDISGQSKFASFSSTYLKGSFFFVIVFDVINERSFQHIPKWIDVVEKAYNCNPDAVHLGVFVNKTDLEPSFNIEKAIEKLMKHYRNRILFILETSAKTGANINDAFETIAQNLLFELENKQNKSC